MIGRLLSRADRARVTALAMADAGHGFDVFGASRDGVATAAALLRPFHQHYFRVRSLGAQDIPASGPCLLASNHSGSLPVDALMLWLDVLVETSPPRLARPVLDHFVPRLPFVGTLFARAGAIGGERENIERLLQSGEVVLVFPEGTTGVGKPFRERYHLQEWRVGHAELAIRHRAPVIPVAVIGAEEQFVQIARLDRLARAFQLPYIPVPLSPLPLPVRYTIHYGAPIVLHARYPDPDDTRAVERAAAEVRAAVEALIAGGLAARRGIFR